MESIRVSRIIKLTESHLEDEVDSNGYDRQERYERKSVDDLVLCREISLHDAKNFILLYR